MLTDAQIAVMGVTQRRELIDRLSAPVEELPISPASYGRRRRFRLAFISVCAIVLVPWIVYLAFTLPTHYQARHWDIAWVGFDVLLLFLLAATAVLGWLRRQLVVVTSFAAGVVLLVDAWFDVTTAGISDRLWSIASALFVELPLAVLLISTSMRLTKLVAVRFLILPAGNRVWEARIPRLDSGVAHAGTADLTASEGPVGGPALLPEVATTLRPQRSDPPSSEVEVVVPASSGPAAHA